MALDSSWEDFGCWTQRAVVPRTSNGDVASECLEPGSECKVEDHLLALSVSSGDLRGPLGLLTQHLQSVVLNQSPGGIFPFRVHGGKGRRGEAILLP